MNNNIFNVLSFILLYINILLIKSSLGNNFVKLFDTPAKFNVESTIFLNDAASHDKEAGFKIKSALEIAALWRGSDNDYLLKFQVKNISLNLLFI